MRSPLQEIRHFIHSQEFADGLRTTIAILLPSLLLSFFDQLIIGTTISIGALCVSLADAPGPLIHKRNGMLFSLLFIFISGLITGLARMNIYVLGLEILICSFFYSMFSVYGPRATAVGSAALLVLILTMDQPIQGIDILWHGLYLAAGGIWYTIISLSFFSLQPYRPAQRALGSCIKELANFLSIKAQFYEVHLDLNKSYKKLFAQQIIVSEKQEHVRELFFKSRQIVKESSSKSTSLLLTFVDTIDMFEEVTATYYDYTSLRQRFEDYTILEDIANFIKQLSQELDAIGLAVQSDSTYTKHCDFDLLLEALKIKMDAVRMQEPGTSNLVLKKIYINIRRLVQRINDIANYFHPEAQKAERIKQLDFKRFIAHQSFDPKLFLDNLNLDSSIFRHSLRVAIACIIGFVISKLFSYGQHSYWILLTIAFILKPAYSLTKQRNVERMIGTLVGGLIGVLILAFIPNIYIQFAFLVFFMVGTYSNIRTNYIAMVIFVTPFVLILFKFIGLGFIDVARERVIDTVIGCAIAFPVSYFLFPKWEAEQFTTPLRNMLQANIDYLLTVAKRFSGEIVKTVDYKLARKEVYIHSANLSAAFQRMLSEPKNKQKNKKDIHQFVVLNHILFSNIASITTSQMVAKPENETFAIRSIRQSLSALCNALKNLDTNCTVPDLKKIPDALPADQEEVVEDLLQKEHLEFIHKISVDIEKSTKRIGVIS